MEQSKFLLEKELPLPLAQLEALQVTWTAKRTEAEAELGRLEREAGRALLAGDSSHRQSVAEARQAAGEAKQILEEIARQMPIARAVDNQNRAKELRAEAEALISQAEEIESQVSPLLDEIQRLEGCRFIIPPSQSRFGGDLPAKSQQLRVRAGKLEDQALNFEISAGEILEKAQSGKRSIPQWVA